MKLSFENLQLPNLSFLHPSTSGPTVTANYMAARPPDLLQRASPTVLLVTIARNRAVLLPLIWIIWRQVDQRKFPNAMISSEYFRKLLTSLKASQTRLDLLFRRNASNTCAADSLIQRQPWSAHYLLTLAISMVDLFTFFSVLLLLSRSPKKHRHQHSRNQRKKCRLSVNIAFTTRLWLHEGRNTAARLSEEPTNICIETFYLSLNSPWVVLPSVLFVGGT